MRPAPWTWPTSSAPAGDPGVRAASVGQLSVVYVINRLTRRLSVLDVIWPPTTRENSEIPHRTATPALTAARATKDHPEPA